MLDFIAMIHDQVAELAREHQNVACGAAHHRPTQATDKQLFIITIAIKVKILL